MAVKSSLTLKDVLSPAIASLALAVSGATFYVTNIQVNDRVTARVSELAPEDGDQPQASGIAKEPKGDDRASKSKGADDDNDPPPDCHPRKGGCGYVAMRVAFINSGNRQAVIQRPDYMFSVKQQFIAGIGGHVDDPDRAFPFVLEPKAIRLIRVRVPVSDMVANLDNGVPVPGNEKDAHRFLVKLKYIAVQSSGELRKASSDMQAEAIVTPEGLVGLAPISNAAGAFPPTELFPHHAFRLTWMKFQPSSR